MGKNILFISTLLALLALLPAFSSAGIFDQCGANCVISANLTLTGVNAFNGNSFTILPNASITLSPSANSILQINAPSISIQGTINASGSDGVNGSAGNWWSTSGSNGEAAGTIILNGSDVNVSGSIIAIGGKGGNGGNYCNGISQTAGNGGAGGSGGNLEIYFQNLSFDGLLNLNFGRGGEGVLNSSCYPVPAKIGSSGSKGEFYENQELAFISKIQPTFSTIASGQTENLSVSQGSGVWSSSNSTIARIISQNQTSVTIQGWMQGTATISLSNGAQTYAELPLSTNWTESSYQFGPVVFSVLNTNSTSIDLLVNSWPQNRIVLNVSQTVVYNSVNFTLEKTVNGVDYLLLSYSSPPQIQTAAVTVIPGNFSYITIQPNPVSMNVNSTQQFTATAFDVGGNVIQTTGFYWNASNSLGLINQTGFLTSGLQAGSLQVTASIGNITGVANVTITGPSNFGPLQSLLIQPLNPTVQSNSTTSFTATAFDIYNNSMIVNASWSAAGNCFNSNNTVTFGSPGLCVVSATFQNLTNTSLATILNQTFYIQGPSNVTAGNTSQYQAVYCNTTCAIVNATWSGNAQNGNFTSGTTGNYVIYAYYNSLTANFTITVTPAVPAYIIVPAYSLTAGVPQQLYAFVYDTLGNKLTNANITFITTSINGSAVIYGGYIFGERAGSILIQAFSDGLTASAVSTVYPGSPVEIQIQPVNPSVKLYSSLPLNVTAIDGLGNKFNLTASWNSPLPITNNVLYASQTGLYKITAYYSNLSSTITVNVYQPVPITEGIGGKLANGLITTSQTVSNQSQQSNSTSSNLNVSGFFTGLTSMSIAPYLLALILVLLIVAYKMDEKKVES